MDPLVDADLEVALRDHDSRVAGAIAVAARTDPWEVEAAFLGGITLARPDLRSALSSYVLASRRPVHRATEHRAVIGCGVCGTSYDDVVDPLDLATHRGETCLLLHHVGHAAVDLALLAVHDVPELSPEAITVGRRLIETLDGLPPGTTPSRATRALSFVPSNLYHREAVLGILGVAGILSVPDHPGHFHRFVPASDRDHPPRRTEQAYPTWWWRSDLGLDVDAVAALLPSL